MAAFVNNNTASSCDMGCPGEVHNLSLRLRVVNAVTCLLSMNTPGEDGLFLTALF